MEIVLAGGITTESRKDKSLVEVPTVFLGRQKKTWFCLTFFSRNFISQSLGKPI